MAFYNLEHCHGAFERFRNPLLPPRPYKSSALHVPETASFVSIRNPICFLWQLLVGDFPVCLDFRIVLTHKQGWRLKAHPSRCILVAKNPFESLSEADLTSGVGPLRLPSEPFCHSSHLLADSIVLQCAMGDRSATQIVWSVRIDYTELGLTGNVDWRVKTIDSGSDP